MGKVVRDEDLRLNIIVNGDPARRKISDLTREVRDLSNENRVLRQEQSRLKGSGQQNTEQYKSLTKQIKENSAVIKRNKAELNSMRDSMSLSCMTMDDLSRKATSLRIALRHTVPGTVAWQELANQLKVVTQRHEELKLQAKETGLTLGNLASKINRYIGLITAGFATFITFKQMINNVRQKYMEYDEALTSASRTTNMTKEEIRELSDELKKLDTRTSQNNLLALAEVAGKLGISGQNDILGFVSAADKINVALSKDLGGNAEEALRQIGKLVDIFKLKDDYGMEMSMLKVGSAINTLGMASTANEGYIVEFAQGMAGIAPTANMSIEQILGFAATLDSLGQRGETATTALGQTIMGMFRRTEQFANVAQMSLEDFTALLNTDVNEALLRVLEGAGQGGTFETVAALSELGLEGQRASQILGSLSQNTDTIRQQQALAAEAFREGTSVIEEFDRMNSSAMATMEKAKKKITEEAVALGEQLTPIITHSLSLTTYGIRLMSSIISFATKYKAVIIGMTTVIALYNGAKKAMIVWEKLTEFYSKRNMVLLRQRARELALLKSAEMAVSKSTALLCTVQNLLVGNLKAANIAFKTLLTSIGPLGWATLAIGTLVTAYQAWKQSADDTSEAVDTMGRISKRVAEETADERAKITSLTSIIHDNKRGILARKAAIEELQRIIPEYKGSLTDEGDLINDNTTAINNYLIALERKIKLQAAEDELVELYKKKRKLEQEQEPARIDRNNATPDGPWNQSLFEQWTGIDFVKSDYKKASERYSKATNEIAEVNRAISVLEKEVADGYETTLTVNVTTTGGDGGSGDDDDNNDDDDGGNGSSWSLGSDADFLKKRLALKNQFLSGEIATEEEYNTQLLDLEIATLQKRLAANADSAEDRLAIQEQLTDKLLEKQQAATKEQEELAMEIARMSDDRVAIENANYEKLKRKYAGNATALEALERAHNARLSKIHIDKFNENTEQRQASYEVERRMMESRHRQELESFEGNQRQLRELRKTQWTELNTLDEQYLSEMINQLSNLVNNGKIGDLEIGVELSDADKAKLLQEIADLHDQLDRLRGASANTEERSSGGGEFWGLSEDEWKDMFKGNLEQWEDWASNIATVMGEVANQVMSLWSSVDKYMTAMENDQLKQFEKNNDKKKKKLEKRLNAGLITESQYNSEIQAMDAEYDAYQEELQLKQAKRQKAMNLTQAIINTALGVTMTLAQWGVPWGLIPAGIMAAMGAAEIALIAATPITTGAEQGGPIGNGEPINVQRAQDGKPFRARLNPNKRGFVSSPTVIVAENGTEYVIPNEAMQNPTVYPLLSAMETARRNGTLDSLDFSAIYSPYSIAGRAIGGYIGENGGISPAFPNSGDQEGYSELKALLIQVLNRLSLPLDARVVMLGRNGLVEKWEQYQKQKNRGNLG